MATQLPISVDEIAIRYRQPYVSEALNRKAAAESGGIRKGFRLTLDGAAANNVVFKTDEQSGLSVMNVANSSDPEFMVTWIRDQDLSVIVPFAASWFHLFVDHGYTLNNETVPTITWYTSAEVLDGNVANPGMYIGSAFGVAEGAQITEIRTSFSLSDGSLLKRATASTSSGARTRVRGDNEEAVFYTDFNGRSMTPIDLKPDLPNRLTARIVTSKETTQLPVNGAALNILNNYSPESNDSMLLIWRRDVDTTNLPNLAGDTIGKRYAIPAHIPLRSVDTGDIPSTVRLFVRYSTLREDAQRFNDPSQWRIGLELASSRESRMGASTVVGIDLYLANSTSISLAQANLENTNQAWRWAVVDVEIPREDATGPVNIIGASVIIDVPNMRSQESIAIDRILVESDVAPLTEGADGHQTLSASTVGRYSNYDLDHPTDTVISPSKRGLALHPAGDMLTHNSSRTVYAIERAAHETSIGLPLRDEANPGRLEVGGEDFSILSSTNNAVDFGHLANLFRQSSLIINAPGMYETKGLIDALEAAGALVPEALRAPQKAGLTVNNGNVVVRKAEGQVRTNFSTGSAAPSHTTGAIFADRAYFNLDLRYGSIDANGVITEGESRTYLAPMSVASLSAYMGLAPTTYATHASMGTLALQEGPVTLGISSPVTSHAVWDSTYYDANGLSDYNRNGFGIMVGDSGQVESDALYIGLKSPLLGATLGMTGISDIRITNHTYSSNASRSTNGVGSTYTADLDSRSLFLGGTTIEFEDTVAPVAFSGTPLVFTTETLLKQPKWQGGVLDNASVQHLRSQRLSHADASNLLMYQAATISAASDLTYDGLGVEVRRAIRVDALSGLKRGNLSDSGLRIDPSASLVVLDFSARAGATIVEDIQDPDEQTDRLVINLYHYLRPLKADGSTYGVGENYEATSVFRFQVLRDPSSFAGFVPDAATAWYSDPYIEFGHEVRALNSSDGTENMRARGIKRHAFYEYMANVLGLATGYGAGFTPVLNGVTAQDYVNAITVFSNRLVISPLSGLLYTNGLTDGEVYFKSASDMQDEIATALGDADYDLFLANDGQRHTLDVSICYDNSFGASSMALHPLSIVPRLYDLFTAYKSTYLN